MQKTMEPIVHRIGCREIPVVTMLRTAEIAGTRMAPRRIIRLAAALAMAAGLALVAVSGARAQKALSDDCTLSMEEAWLEHYIVEAHTSGECGLGEVDLVVRNGVDEVFWSASYRTGDLFGFDEVRTPDAMREALTDWLVTNTMDGTSGDLPEWPEGTEAPDAGEFPFLVEDGISQAVYEQLRTEARPMICYVQGRESMLCLLRDPDSGGLDVIGVQTFPG